MAQHRNGDSTHRGPAEPSAVSNTSVGESKLGWRGGGATEHISRETSARSPAFQPLAPELPELLLDPANQEPLPGSEGLPVEHTAPGVWRMGSTRHRLGNESRQRGKNKA